MDKLEKRLRNDAGAVDGNVPRELRARIDASLAAVKRRASHDSVRSPLRIFNRASGLVGIAAALLVIAVLNWPFTEPDPQPVSATPVYVAELPNPIRLKLRQAELTDPLQQEISNLRADADKVRNALERDLGVTF